MAKGPSATVKTARRKSSFVPETHLNPPPHVPETPLLNPYALGYPYNPPAPPVRAAPCLPTDLDLMRFTSLTLFSPLRTTPAVMRGLGAWWDLVGEPLPEEAVALLASSVKGIEVRKAFRELAAIADGEVTENFVEVLVKSLEDFFGASSYYSPISKENGATATEAFLKMSPSTGYRHHHLPQNEFHQAVPVLLLAISAPEVRREAGLTGIS